MIKAAERICQRGFVWFVARIAQDAEMKRCLCCGLLLQAELSAEKEALANAHATTKFSHAANLERKRQAHSQSHGDKVRMVAVAQNFLVCCRTPVGDFRVHRVTARARIANIPHPRRPFVSTEEKTEARPPEELLAVAHQDHEEAMRASPRPEQRTSWSSTKRIYVEYNKSDI